MVHLKCWSLELAVFPGQVVPSWFGWEDLYHHHPLCSTAMSCCFHQLSICRTFLSRTSSQHITFMKNLKLAHLSFPQHSMLLSRLQGREGPCGKNEECPCPSANQQQRSHKEGGKQRACGRTKVAKGEIETLRIKCCYFLIHQGCGQGPKALNIWESLQDTILHLTIKNTVTL